MITGQYTGKVLLNNNGIQKINRYYEANNPEALKNNFTEIGSNAINSLNLTRIYILTTKVLPQQVSLL
jgi:hypothetical protein